MSFSLNMDNLYSNNKNINLYNSNKNKLLYDDISWKGIIRLLLLQFHLISTIMFGISILSTEVYVGFKPIWWQSSWLFCSSKCLLTFKSPSNGLSYFSNGIYPSFVLRRPLKFCDCSSDNEYSHPSVSHGE